MPFARHIPSSLRHVLVAAGLAGAVAAGCGGSTKCADTDCSAGGAGGGASTTGGGGAAACTDTKGTIAGTLYLNALPDQPNSQVAANSTVTFVLSPGGPGAPVLNGQTDAEGKFSVLLDPGTWIVSGTEPSGCIPTSPVTVDLAACETEQVELALDTCPG